MIRVRAPALLHLRPGLRLADPAQPIISVQERRTARPAARGRRTTSDQSAAAPGLGPPRGPGRADPAPADTAPADTAADAPADHPRHRPAVARRSARVMCTSWVSPRTRTGRGPPSRSATCGWARQSQQPQTRSSTEHSGALPLHGLRAAILLHPGNACLYRRATISSSIRAVIEVRWGPPLSTWAVTVTTASLSGEIMQSWP
jgi:hypothetical protein